MMIPNEFKWLCTIMTELVIFFLILRLSVQNEDLTKNIFRETLTVLMPWPNEYQDTYC